MPKKKVQIQYLVYILNLTFQYFCYRYSSVYCLSQCFYSYERALALTILLSCQNVGCISNVVRYFPTSLYQDDQIRICMYAHRKFFRHKIYRGFFLGPRNSIYISTDLDKTRNIFVAQIDLQVAPRGNFLI